MSVTATMGIITPEAVVLEFRAAGLATRTLAKLIDLVLQAVVMGILLFIALAGFQVSGSQTALTIAWSLILFVSVLLLPALTEWFTGGRTPGKIVLGLRVVTVEGGPTTFRHALVRGLLQLIELPLGVAVVVALANPRSQRLGDLAAGTFVISERAASSLTIPTAFSAPPGLEWYTAQLDVSRVDSEQFLLVRNFLLRVNQLDGTARFALAAQLATSLVAMCSPPPPAGVPPELYLIAVCAAYQARHGR